MKTMGGSRNRFTALSALVLLLTVVLVVSLVPLPAAAELPVLFLVFGAVFPFLPPAPVPARFLPVSPVSRAPPLP